MHVGAIARTFVGLHARTRARTRSQTVLANARKCTQINARKRSLRFLRGRFLRANAIALCALDLKLSGCTIDGFQMGGAHYVISLPEGKLSAIRSNAVRYAVTRCGLHSFVIGFLRCLILVLCTSVRTGLE